MFKKLFFISSILLLGCKDKVETLKPEKASITESVYASGLIKSKDQYLAYATINGIIENVYVRDGDKVKIGDPILSISNLTQQLNRENAALAANFSDLNSNQGKLDEALQSIDFLKNKYKNDSILFDRQLKLWNQQIGSKVELEQRELSFENSKNAYKSAVVRYNDLKRQISFNASQSKNNLQISSNLEEDFTVKSAVNGIVYNINKRKGEIVNPQTPLATIGDATVFILEMQVDENDIFKIKLGQSVLVTLDSYKNNVFEAKVSKINPIMNERSKTFLIEATFLKQPELLYPNITFEANIVLRSKENAVLIPRNYLMEDNKVKKANGDIVKVTTGLKDFQKVEILSGIDINDEIQKPK